MIQWIERILWMITLVAIGTTAQAWRVRSRHSGVSAALALPAMPRIANRPTLDSLEDAVSDMTEQNLFRTERESAEQGPASPAAAIQQGALALAPPHPAAPQLVLRGIIGGPPWEAIIDGIPGHEAGVLLRAGQGMAGVAIRTVRRDTVVARGFDTTWVLTLSR